MRFLPEKKTTIVERTILMKMDITKIRIGILKPITLLPVAQIP